MEKKGEKWEEEQAVRERVRHLPGAGEGGTTGQRVVPTGGVLGAQPDWTEA